MAGRTFSSVVFSYFADPLLSCKIHASFSLLDCVRTVNSIPYRFGTPHEYLFSYASRLCHSQPLDHSLNSMSGTLLIAAPTYP